MREAIIIQPNLLYSMVYTHGIQHHHMLYSIQYSSCYILWYIACYIICCVEAGLLDPPWIENQWCSIACVYTMLYSRLGYIASLIYSILLYSTYFMLYRTCIQQVLYSTRLYSTLISYIAMLIAGVKAIQHQCKLYSATQASRCHGPPPDSADRLHQQIDP